jgi:hypothetical protein
VIRDLRSNAAAKRAAEQERERNCPPTLLPVSDPFSRRSRKRRFEVATTGLDEYLQGIGDAPAISSNWVGLRVPTLATATINKRYLFLLCQFSVGHGEKVVLRGFRQMATLWNLQAASGGEAPAPARPIEQEITTPFWRFPDGNISWHIMLLGPPNAQGIARAQGAVDLPSFKFQYADGPALLYGPPAPAAPAGGFYPNIASYTPPNGGRPYGVPIQAKLGTFYDLRTPWRADRAWDSLDIPVEGPETVAFFASVRQTNPSTRAVLTPPGTTYPLGIPPEEQFLLNFPNAIYGRVAGSMIVEEY